MWASAGEFVCHTFGRQALPMVWDFAEVNPLSDTGWLGACEWVRRVIEANANAELSPGIALQASATNHPLPTDAAEATITDPPYYAAIPYTDLSDFFYGWLQRSVGNIHSELFKDELAPKEDECVSLAHRAAMYRHKDAAWFEQKMTEACSESRRVTKPDGIGLFVFANKETAGWEAMLGALISSSWVITASWPIDTERGGRLRARNSAALTSSVHLVCRPRENPDGTVITDRIGDWRDVLQELPRRIHEWMPRLCEEGIVGADAIFACLGPALEIFSRYSQVEKASGEQVTLREYLEQVWAAVAKEAFNTIFEGANVTGFEEDARLTAIWFWVLKAANGNGTISAETDVIDRSEGASNIEDEVSEPKGKKTAEGYTMEYDAVRKLAQGLGVNLERLGQPGGIIVITGSTAILNTVAMREQYLFGRQLSFFEEMTK
jgi:adenine-specific DNA methylase